MCSSSTNPRCAAKRKIRFTFVRHGATDWNGSGRFQGQSDIPLNELGRAQARAVASALRGQTFDLTVSSDLSRAAETAGIITPRSHVRRDPRWREFAFGDWEGLTWDEIVVRDPDLARYERSAAKIYAPPGGDTFDAVRARVRTALDEYLRSAYERVLIVTHAGPLHAMLHEFFESAEPPMNEVLGVRFVPASITVVEASEGRISLEQLNEAGHLAP